ncbi:MAG: hypothetical protein CR984_05345 [Proteobacteria bacterium]|nr:MAG: hypothetical protein CR984_05345 [Pseudomonadota bacterium]
MVDIVEDKNVRITQISGKLAIAGWALFIDRHYLYHNGNRDKTCLRESSGKKRRPSMYEIPDSLLRCLRPLQGSKNVLQTPHSLSHLVHRQKSGEWVGGIRELKADDNKR